MNPSTESRVRNPFGLAVVCLLLGAILALQLFAGFRLDRVEDRIDQTALQLGHAVTATRASAAAADQAAASAASAARAATAAHEAVEQARDLDERVGQLEALVF